MTFLRNREVDFCSFQINPWVCLFLPGYTTANPLHGAARPFWWLLQIPGSAAEKHGGAQGTVVFIIIIFKTSKCCVLLNVLALFVCDQLLWTSCQGTMNRLVFGLICCIHSRWSLLNKWMLIVHDVERLKLSYTEGTLRCWKCNIKGALISRELKSLYPI